MSNKPNVPAVSVIIPNYNHAPFLHLRINSVLRQTCQDFELILLDDCSSDNSRDIIETYRYHPKVSHIILNEENSGSTFKQWQKGIELATGNCIWIAESDDYCETILLETLMKGMADNPHCTVAYCQSYSISSDGVIYHISRAKQLEEYHHGIDFIRHRLIYHSVIYNASMVIFKRETYLAISKDFTSFRFCGDWLFWSEMVSRGDVFVSGKVLNYYRYHSDKVSNTMYETGNSFIEQFRCLLLLKQKFSVQESVYKKALSHYTTLYFDQKKKFSPAVNAAIKEWLNKEENKKYKSYLQRQWLRNRIRKAIQKVIGLSPADS